MVSAGDTSRRGRQLVGLPPAAIVRMAGLAAAALTMLFASPARPAAGAETSLAPVSLLGWEVDATTGADVCAISSGDRCRSTSQSTSAGGFGYPAGVAVDPRTGDLYVAELNNDRVQELSATGAFVAVLGSSARQESDGGIAADACAGRAFCGAGARGSAAGQLAAPESVAVDPRTGDVYALAIATGDLRVDKLTSTGRFAWRVGRGVNRATGGNLCTAREAGRCGHGAPNADGSDEHGAFKFANQSGDLLAVDARRGLVYVGDEHRVQVFGTDGRWRREIPLVSISAAPQSSVVALALDAAGDLYVVYRTSPPENLSPRERADLIHEFSPSGAPIAVYQVVARSPSSVISIEGMAIAPSGRLAVMGIEVGPITDGRFALLGRAGSRRPLAAFAPPSDNDGIAFGAQSRLYAATAVDETVEVYAPVSPPSALSEPLPCLPGLEARDAPASECGRVGGERE